MFGKGKNICVEPLGPVVTMDLAQMLASWRGCHFLNVQLSSATTLN